MESFTLEILHEKTPFVRSQGPQKTREWPTAAAAREDTLDLQVEQGQQQQQKQQQQQQQRQQHQQQQQQRQQQEQRQQPISNQH